MAHVEKYTRTQINNLFRHYERSYISDNVDKDRTYLNYNLHNDNRKGIEILQERLNNVHCLKRKDVNIICSWVVTAPKNLDTEHHEQFFKETYNFLNDRYGHNNTISAYVHKDEKQPHLHFVFAPIVKDKKRNIEKVCAKDVINRKELKVFHTELKKHLEHKMNMNIDILNNATINGNKSIVELKRESAIKEIEMIEHITNVKRESAYDNIQNYERLTKDAEKNLNTKQAELEQLKNEIQAQENKLNSVLDDIQKAHINNNIYFNDNQIEHLRETSILKEKKNFLTRKETVVIDKDVYNKMCDDLKELYADNKRCNTLLNMLGSSMLENEELKQENKKIKIELQQEKTKSFNRLIDNKNLKCKLDKFYKKYPLEKKELEKTKERKV